MSTDTLRYGIPKLLRVHFANVGHAASRLDPLTLPFCQQTGAGLEPVHATIWAENGVGKTSIRSLLFSVLQPDVHRVMKSANAGGGKREYQGFFFKGNDHAVILMEWAFDDVHPRLPGMGNAGGFRRIVGMTANWSSRASGLALDKRPLGELERTFISFTPNQGVNWDIMPVKGLSRGGGDYCKTSKDLLDWLRTHRESIDLRIYQTQSTWREHLEELGLDPKLFDNQLNMNGSGGAIQVFKDRIRTPRDFVRFYLESSLPENIGEELVELIVQDRKIILDRDIHESGLEYLRATEQPLNGFAATVREVKDARGSLDHARGEAARIVGMLDALAHRAAGEMQSVETSEADTKRQQKLGEVEVARLKLYLQVLEHQTAKRVLEERQLRLGESKKRVHVAEQRLSLVEAHGKWRALKDAEDELAPIEEQCNKLHAEEQELLAGLRTAGSTWFARLQEDITSLSSQRRRAENDLAGVQELLNGLRTERESLLQCRATLDAEIRQLRTTLANADEGRAALLREEILARDEDPRRARERHAATVAEADANVAKQQHIVDDTNSRVHALKAQADPLEQARASTVRGLQQAEASFADARAMKSRLQAHEALCWVLDATEMALGDEGLLEAVGAAIQNRTAQRDDLSLRLADLRRRLRPLNDVENGLISPPGDTEKACQMLRTHGVNAFTAGSWLDKNCNVDRAMLAIATDPGRYTGLMVHTKAELERISVIRDAVRNLDHPVVVSTVGIDDHSTPQTDRLVLLPEHPATFNREAAKKLAEQLRHQVGEGEGTLKILTRQLDAAKDEAVVLRQFVNRFPRGELQSLGDAVSRCKAAVNECDRAITSHAKATGKAENELIACRQRFDVLRAAADVARQHEQRMRDWLLRFEVTLGNNRLPQAEQELAATNTRIEQKQRDGVPLEKDAETYRHRIAEVAVQIRATEECRDEIPKELRTGTVCDWSLTRAKTAYADAKRRLEQAQTDESRALMATRDERRKVVTRARLELTRYCESKGIDLNQAAKVTLRVSYDEVLTDASVSLNEARRLHSIDDHEVRQATEALNRHGMPVSYRRHAEDKEPRNGEEGLSLIADTKGKLAVKEQALRDGQDSLHELARRRIVIEGQQKEIAAQQREWQAELELTAITWTGSSLPTTDLVLQAARAAIESFRSANRRFVAARQQRDVAYQVVDTESRNRRWDSVDAEKRRSIQQGPDSLAEIVEVVLREYRTWRDVIVDSLKRAEDAVGQITDRLTTLVKSDGLAVINHAQSGSRLPDGIGEWSNRPFLKIDLSGADTRNLSAADIEPYCKQVVRHLLGDEKEFDGRELIIRVLDELAGTGGYKVTLLKPSHTLTPERHDIVQLASWSDGEIITAAILLYCCLVQARTWHRTGAGRSTRQRSNGILLLDNPFGEANSPDFVQLQVEMASKLGVQLIYTASGDPRELLAMFRRNNRLFQRHGKGVKHVGVEDAIIDEAVVGRGTVGLRHG